jgi:hypothetical protein
MGGLLKSEDEDMAEKQLASQAQLFRVTAMVYYCKINLYVING